MTARSACVPVLVAMLLLSGVACRGGAGPAVLVRRDPPFHLSSVAGSGDGARRASQQLVLAALDRDDQGNPGSARELYRRALQVDPNNPYAYLAFARHYAEWGEPRQVLSYLDQATVWSAGDEGWSRQVEAHVAGLRGSALRALGREPEARVLLDEARDFAPSVWDDGFLSADELR